MSEKNEFTGIWIPKEVWENKELGWSEKLMLVQINSLDNEFGCTQGNEKFAKFFNLSEDRVSRIIRGLVKGEYIYSKITRHQNNKTSRILKVNKIKFYGVTEENIKMHQNGENADDVFGENADKVNGENNEYINKSLNNKINKDSLSVDKSTDVKSVMELYDSIDKLPKYRGLSDKRKSHINSRLKEYNIEVIKEVLMKCNMSSYLSGNPGNWYNIDWIFNHTNFLKILEGKYDDSNRKSNLFNPYAALENEFNHYKEVNTIENDNRADRIAIPENVNTLF